MAIIEVQAKTILTTIQHPDELFGMKYNMNLYRGCQHQCIYCDSRSKCYEIENFNHDVLVKVNALDLLERELPRKRVKGVVGTGSMNDPYMPLEEQRQLTRRALMLIAKHHFGVTVITKSDLVLRDLDLLQEIQRVQSAVCLSITTADDDLSRMVEPGAPPSSARFEAIRALSAAGVPVGVTMMPILPFLEDSPENITAIVTRAVDCGARFVIPWFGMSLRDRQRDYYYQKLDRLFPDLRARYERTYGERYGCQARGAKALSELFYQLCERHRLGTRVPPYSPREEPSQLSLF